MYQLFVCTMTVLQPFSCTEKCYDGLFSHSKKADECQYAVLGLSVYEKNLYGGETIAMGV